MKENIYGQNTSRALIFMAGFLFITSTRTHAQEFSPRDLLGKWQAINGKESLQIKFIDSTHVYFIREEGQPINNMLLGYTIDTLKNQFILNVIFPTGFILKSFLWIKNKTQIKILGIDIMNYKDPMKKNPQEEDPKTIILRKQNEQIRS